MKKEYRKPVMVAEQFAANVAVAACTSEPGVFEPATVVCEVDDRLETLNVFNSDGCKAEGYYFINPTNGIDMDGQPGGLGDYYILNGTLYWGSAFPGLNANTIWHWGKVAMVPVKNSSY